MSRTDSAVVPAILTLVIAGILCAAPWARAKEGPAGAPRKIDQPFLSALVGTWDWTSKTPSGAEEKGAETFRLGLMDTAVLDEIDGVSQGGAFQGHGVLKPSDDGKSLSGWWFFSALPGVKAFRGTLTADGYDLKSDDGERMSLHRTAGGLEMKAFQGDSPTRTVTFTKR